MLPTPYSILHTSYFLLLLTTLFIHGTAMAGAATSPVEGFAWSENIGWVQLSCPESLNGVTLDNFKLLGSAWSENIGWVTFNGYGYNVTVSEADGALSGYGWSDKIGWVSFERATAGDPPGPPFEQNGAIARYDLSTKEFSGWARALSYGDGWDGWIKLRGPGYGVSLGTSNKLSGYAWGGDVIGWLKFDVLATVCTQNYSANYDTATRQFGGLAWSEGLGWLDFAPAGGYPAASGVTPAAANLDQADKLQGWARFTALQNAPPPTGQLSGYAWSESIGWVSLRGIGQAGQTYGVTANLKTGPGQGYVSGLAWSPSVGWISFNRSETGAPPAEPTYQGQPIIAFYNLALGNLYGWARVLSHGGGWDGWIKLRGSGYGVSADLNTGKLSGYAWGGDVVGWLDFGGLYNKIDIVPQVNPDFGWVAFNGNWTNGVSINRDTCEFNGYAWGGESVGWLSMNCANAGVCQQSNYRTIMAFPGCSLKPDPPTNLNITPNNINAPFCAAEPAFRFTWQFGDPDILNGDSQGAYEIQIDNDPNFLSPQFDSGKVTASNPETTISLKDSEIAYGGLNYWRVKAWDSQNRESDWSAAAEAFTAPVHPLPRPDFDWLPKNILPGQSVQFDDLSAINPASQGLTYAWLFEGGAPDPNTAAEAAPKVRFTAPSADITATLTLTDNAGTCALGKDLKTGRALPKYREVSPAQQNQF